MRSYAFAFVLSLALLGGQGWAAPLCAAPGKDGPAYNPDTYYAGSGTASTGSQTVSLGAMRAGDGNASTTPIAAGDQVFIIQMQGADINPAGGTLTNNNTTTYGDGSTGRGYTALNTTGQYEFAVVSSVSGSVLTLRGPLTNSYVSSGAATTATRKSFQVIRVPQHSSLTLTSNITTPAWNGFTGGVTVLDVAGTLNFGSATIDASGAGFRGGGSFKNGDLHGQGVTDYANVWNGIGGTSRGSMKGEGIAGTPSLVRRVDGDTSGNFGGADGTAANLASGDLGYPNAYVVARGAPGNAGGGGTQHNAGGGGGSNAGVGGKGGYTWIDDGKRDMGGLGGVAITPTSKTLIAGGGGGAGDDNNFVEPYGGFSKAPKPVSSGGNGGGIIFIRAGTLAGSVTLNANGQAGGGAGWDGGGGGGAGGTVAVMAGASTASLSISVQGGKGGDSGNVAEANAYGPGGGGGGGAVLLSNAVTASPNVSGGTNGQMYPLNPSYNTYKGPYGAVAGNGGVGPASYSPSTANVSLPSDCLPQISVVKTTSTPERIKGTDTQATYTITVSNAAERGDAVDVTVSDSGLPGSMTYKSTTGIALTPINATVSDGYKPTHYNETVPTSSTAPAWSSFRIPGGGSVSIAFEVNLNDTPVGTYQNPAQATYLDPTRTTTAGTASATYDAASSNGEDVTIKALKPNVQLDKWVRNVSRSENFNKSDSGLPGETLEYCINFREENGVDANNFVLTDSSADMLGHADVLPDAYGPGLGVRLYSGIQLTSTTTPPAAPSAALPTVTGSDLTSDSDTDAAQVSQAGGLVYKTDLLGGTKGVVCFQVKMK